MLTTIFYAPSDYKLLKVFSVKSIKLDLIVFVKFLASDYDEILKFKRTPINFWGIAYSRSHQHNIAQAWTNRKFNVQ